MISNVILLDLGLLLVRGYTTRRSPLTSWVTFLVWSSLNMTRTQSSCERSNM